MSGTENKIPGINAIVALLLIIPFYFFNISIPLYFVVYLSYLVVINIIFYKAKFPVILSYLVLIVIGLLIWKFN
ncbi:hypothetical protein SAMN05216244_3057 [Sediminibacillus halophilus]|uniref:Uncharacterized protein n=1 Tax=Sediminibacillus halophilus TaxID=482461 RepID=A0A1G9UZ71_9BACI|nr:hypothetical protein SAMN05216244_3057 [Sediminibacillus halophilus]